MGYRLSFEEVNDLFKKLQEEYRIYAPKKFEKAGRYSDTDIIKYDEVDKVEDIVYKEKSDYPAKEVITPITQTIFYFTEDEFRESKTDDKKLLIFARPCDINAQERQDKMYLENGPYTDYFYKRMKDKVKFILMECTEGWDTCFCVSMGSNKTENYSLAVRFNGDELLFDIKDEEFKSYFEDKNREDFDLQFIEQNEVNVDIPEIPNKDVLNKLKKHSMWDEYNKRCIGCGSCTVACSTCTCFTTSDVIYNENINAGERRRIQSSCQPEGLEFDVMAGGISFRDIQADRYRFKILHKIHDYKERFGDNHMCVGCGRCITRCPEHISIMATIKKISKALKEICGGEV